MWDFEVMATVIVNSTLHVQKKIMEKFKNDWATRYIFLLFLMVNSSVLSAQVLEEAAADVGVNILANHFSDMGGGGAFFDYDGDGFEDLYITGGRDLDRLYRNNGNGTFTDVTLEAGLGITGSFYTHAVIAGDIDNDGFRDIFVTTWGTNISPAFLRRNLLFKNNGDGTFTEIGEAANVLVKSRSAAATFVDYNQDGFLDICVVNYVSAFDFIIDEDNEVIGYAHDCFENQFYINNGNGLFFVDMGVEIGLSDEGCALAVASTDYDQDGDTDVYVANDFGQWIIPNALFSNDNMGGFSSVGEASGAGIGLYGMGIAVGDYDLDQDIDFYVTNIGRNVLLNNDGTGQYVDTTTFAGVENTFGPFGNFTTSWGAAFIDYDDNMYPDLFVANGYIPSADFLPTSVDDPSKLYYNNGDGTFTDVSDMEGFNDQVRNRGLAACDFDQDGDLDIFMGTINGHPNLFSATRFYRNNLDNNHHWLQVKLTGVTTNRDAIGSRLRLHVGGEVLLREVSGGSSHASQHSIIQHFGLAEHTQIDSLEIFWLGGERQVIHYVEPNQILHVTQGVDPNVRLNLQVDMRNETVDPSGVFADVWTGNDTTIRYPMLDTDGDMIYEAIVERHRPYQGAFSFFNGDCPDDSCQEPLSDPDCTDAGNTNYRVLSNVESDTTILACFASCLYEDCFIPDSVSIAFQVDMNFEVVSPEGVYLAGGAFGAPGAYPLTDPEEDGVYTISVMLPYGFESVYRFTNGTCPDFACAENLMGQAVLPRGS
jgi:hypothetical protein